MKHYIESDRDREIGDGFVRETDDWQAEPGWADVIVFDDVLVGSGVDTGALAQELPLVGIGKGVTMQNARSYTYERLDNIVILNRYYRDDIGERWSNGDGNRLQAWGYLGPSAT